MSEALEILIISVELFIFYLRAICDRILRRDFGYEVSIQSLSPHWLESPSRWNTTTWFHAVPLVLLIAHLILRLVRS
jgi:hypothetical protein